MKIQLNTTPEELPEQLKPICDIGDDGTITLDTAKVKTEEDVAKVLQAKSHANAELTEVKKQLADYKALNMAADDIKGLMESNKTVTKVTQQLRDAEKQIADAKPKLEQYERLLEAQTKADIRQKVNKVIEQLPQPYDRAKIQALSEDYLDKFKLDASGELAPINDTTVNDFLKNRADIFGLHTQSKGANISTNKDELKKAVDGGDIMAALKFAPRVTQQ